MKNFLKASILTLIMSAGISFSSNSACAVDPDTGCLICAFKAVPNNPGACRGTGGDCPDIRCGGSQQ